jgi:hypothetical protein
VAFLSRLLEAGVDVRFADLPQIEGATGRFRCLAAQHCRSAAIENVRPTDLSGGAGAPEIEITPAMIEAGQELLRPLKVFFDGWRPTRQLGLLLAGGRTSKLVQTLFRTCPAARIERGL